MVPRLCFGFVKAVEQIDGEVTKTGLFVRLGEGLLDERAGLVAVHLASSRKEERITSRGLSACPVCCARKAWKNSKGISRRRMPKTLRGLISFLSTSAPFFVVGRG